jgi:hypothetical protein
MTYTFTASWFNGGTPYAFTYTTTASGFNGSDLSSAAILQANVYHALFNDATLGGHIFFTNSGGLTVYPLTPQLGALTLTYSGTPPSAVVNLVPSTLPASGNATFRYNYVLDAFIYDSLYQAAPLEYMVQLCNQVGASMWYNWPINTSSAYVTALTNYVAANLNSNLKFGTEIGNEMWNFGLGNWAKSFAYGMALGCGQAAQSQNVASYSWTGLKTKQFGTASIAAWTGSGRSRSQHYILGMSAVWDLTNTNSYQWAGSQLDASANTTFGNYGGVDGIAGSTNTEGSHNASPNRPIDIMDAVGVAPYWGSDFLAGDTGGPGFSTNTLTSTVAANAALFTAALKYQQGNTAGSYGDLYNQFYTNVSLGGPAGGINLLRDYKNSTHPQVETICRSYDHSRSKPLSVMHYEGGPQFGLGNINVGTNNATTDIPAVQTHIQNNITNSAWDVSAYTVSGTNNANELATSLVGMVYNFKFSTQFYNLYRNYMVDVTTVHSGRECYGSQYGYSQNQWCIFPGNWAAGVSTAYSSYQAISDFDAGA